MAASVWVVKVSGPLWITGHVTSSFTASAICPALVCVLQLREMLQVSSIITILSGSDFGVEAGLSGACGIAAAVLLACLFNV